MKTETRNALNYVERRLEKLFCVTNYSCFCMLLLRLREVVCVVPTELDLTFNLSFSYPFLDLHFLVGFFSVYPTFITNPFG